MLSYPSSLPSLTLALAPTLTSPSCPPLTPQLRVHPPGSLPGRHLWVPLLPHHPQVVHRVPGRLVPRHDLHVPLAHGRTRRQPAIPRTTVCAGTLFYSFPLVCTRVGTGIGEGVEMGVGMGMRMGGLCISTATCKVTSKV